MACLQASIAPTLDHHSHTLCSSSSWYASGCVATDLLRAQQHIRYMWIPHTDSVVVVCSNPVPSAPALEVNPLSEQQKTQPLANLLLTVSDSVSAQEAADMNFAQLRDALLAVAPLDKGHVAKVLGSGLGGAGLAGGPMVC